MTNEYDIHVVRKVEYHLWRLCPCVECEEERKRRRQAEPPTNVFISVPIRTAQFLGLVPYSDQGSLARRLAKDKALAQ